MEKDFIRNRVYQLRTSHNISARNLSLELGMSSEYINQLEGGKLNPSIDFLINFCAYFSISLSEFFDDGNKYPTKIKPLLDKLFQLNADEFDLLDKLITLLLANKK
ncbi:MAG TPA: XRE family transcriptional regulator [Clostridiales bacterium]|nr:XRE family transcriptional regulator [Clostridiales bacterium]